jgi:hypothetical protein
VPTKKSGKTIANISAAQLTQNLRAFQEQDKELGLFFKLLHEFVDRTIDRFYDERNFPYPVISMDKDSSSRMGFYQSQDGYRMVNRINLNPYAHENGMQAAETAIHEVVHMWQTFVGRPCKRNFHTDEFHNKMGNYGIITSGRKGNHVDHTEVWHDWVSENSDLTDLLAQFKLPGQAEKPKPRKLNKFICPSCGFTIHHRRENIDVICMEDACEVEMVPA